MTQTKIEKLMAIKEQFANTQTRLVAARKLEESAQANRMSTLLENDLEQAELVLAAQDIMHKLQNMAEDLAKMNAQDLFPLVDKMKATFGQEAAHAFEETAQEAISGAMNTVRRAKDEMGNSIMRIEGKMPASDMAAGAGMDADPMSAQAGSSDPAADVSGTADVDSAMDSFGAADAASGPAEEPLGRARKESIEGGNALNESMILESAGRKLLVSEGLDSLISWVLNEAAAGMPEDHFRSFATSVAQKAAKDPAKLAGWIGKKKHGMAAMAQLAEPTYTASADLEIAEGKTFKKNDKEDSSDKADRFKAMNQARKEKAKGNDKVDEGKTFKKGEDEDEDADKADRFAARNQARKNKAKGDDKVEEGKTFKANDEDDDNWKKKSGDVAKNNARKEKNKGDDKVVETALAVRAIAELIEANIKRDGKGQAAKAVREAVAYLTGSNLVESDVDIESIVMEAFTEAYGMKPASYSVHKLREFIAPMSTSDQKNASAAMTKVAGNMGTNPSAAKQSVSQAMAGMNGTERSAAQKMLNNMKTNGQAPKNAGEFAAAASNMIDGDDKPGAPGAPTAPTGTSSAPVGEGLEENINAAHWPIDDAGQYKGEPMSTDYGKLKPISTPKAGKTETTSGSASEVSLDAPKSDAPKKDAAPKAEKSEGGKPWEKKSEPKEEKAEEPKEESEDDDSE